MSMATLSLCCLPAPPSCARACDVPTRIDAASANEKTSLFIIFSRMKYVKLLRRWAPGPARPGERNLRPGAVACRPLCSRACGARGELRFGTAGGAGVEPPQTQRGTAKSLKLCLSVSAVVKLSGLRHLYAEV